MALSNVQRAAVAIVSATTLIAGGTAAYNMYMSKYVAQPLTLLEKHNIPQDITSTGDGTGKVTGEDIANAAAKLWIHYQQSGVHYSQNACTKIYVDRALKYNALVNAFNKHPELKEKWGAQDPFNKFPFNRTADCNSYVTDVLHTVGLRPPSGYSSDVKYPIDAERKRANDTAKEDKDKKYKDVLVGFSAGMFKDKTLIGNDPYWTIILEDQTTDEVVSQESTLKRGDIAACGGHVQIYDGKGLWWSWETNYLNDAKNPDGKTERREYTTFEKEVFGAPPNKEGKYVYVHDETFPNQIEYTMPCPLRDHLNDKGECLWTIIRYQEPKEADDVKPYVRKINGYWGDDPGPHPGNDDRMYLGSTTKIKLSKTPHSGNIVKEFDFDTILAAYRAKWVGTSDVKLYPKLSNYVGYMYKGSLIDKICNKYDSNTFDITKADKSTWKQSNLDVIQATHAEYIFITRSEPHEMRYLYRELADVKAHTVVSRVNNKINYIIQTGFAIGNGTAGLYYTNPNGADYDGDGDTEKVDNYIKPYTYDIGSTQFIQDAQLWDNGVLEYYRVVEEDIDYDDDYYLVGIRYYND